MYYARGGVYYTLAVNKQGYKSDSSNTTSFAVRAGTKARLLRYCSRKGGNRIYIQLRDGRTTWIKDTRVSYGQSETIFRGLSIGG